MGEQKPGQCPFCGRTVNVIKFAVAGAYCVGCTECRALGPVKPTEAEAIAAWNAPGEKAAALVGALGAVTEEAADLQEYHGDALNRNAVPNARALLATD